MNKNIDITSNMYDDKNFIVVLYIGEWIKAWLSQAKDQLKNHHYVNLIEFLNRNAKQCLLDCDIAEEMLECNRDSLPLYIGLLLYSNTVNESVSNEILEE